MFRQHRSCGLALLQNRLQDNQAEHKVNCVVVNWAMRRLQQITAFVLAAAFLTSLELSILNADEPAPNAALEYWMAFALIPNLSSADIVKIDSATGDHPTYGFAVPVRPELKRFFHGSGERALARLQRASELSFCTWGTDLRKDGQPPAPYAEKAHFLARLSLLRARWRFERGLWNEGIDDVIATMVMARHIGRDKVVFTIHFGVMIESMSVVTAAVYLPRMPAKPRARLSAKLKSLPPFTSMQEVFQHREKGIDWFIDYARQAEKDGQLRERIEAISSPDTAMAVLGNAHDAAGLARLAEDARALLKEGADLLELGVDEFRREYKQRKIGARRKNNPVAQILVPKLDFEHDEQAIARVRLALFKAGIDVIGRGQVALRDHSDPSGHGPFAYTAFDGGFELLSKFSRPAGSPMCQSLDFGLRKNGPKLKRPCR